MNTLGYFFNTFGKDIGAFFLTALLFFVVLFSSACVLRSCERRSDLSTFKEKARYEINKEFVEKHRLQMESKENILYYIHNSLKYIPEVWEYSGFKSRITNDLYNIHISLASTEPRLYINNKFVYSYKEKNLAIRALAGKVKIANKVKDWGAE